MLFIGDPNSLDLDSRAISHICKDDNDLISLRKLFIETMNILMFNSNTVESTNLFQTIDQHNYMLVRAATTT